MTQVTETDPVGHQLFPAGVRVPPGRYKQLDGPQTVELEHEDVLPAGLDGHATCYAAIRIWGDCQSPSRPGNNAAYGGNGEGFTAGSERADYLHPLMSEARTVLSAASADDQSEEVKP